MEETYREHDIEIEPVKLDSGRWTAEVNIETRLGQTIQGLKKTDLPDFGTEAEAVQHAIEFAGNLVDKLLLTPKT